MPNRSPSKPHKVFPAVPSLAEPIRNRAIRIKARIHNQLLREFASGCLTTALPVFLLVLGVLVCLLGCGGSPPSAPTISHDPAPPPPALVQVAVTTYHNDNDRTGANTQEATLTITDVNMLSFGKLRAFPVSGYVYAQPLFVPGVNIQGAQHDVLYVADEHDTVTAFDVHTFAMLWQTSFLSDSGRYIVSTLSSDDDLGCDDLVPEIGITGTPVIDVSRNTLYVVARTKAIDTQTGDKQFMRPCTPWTWERAQTA